MNYETDPKKLLDLLQKKEHDPYYKNEYNETSLMVAVKKNNELAVSILLSYKADTNTQDIFFMTPLHWACIKNNSNLVSLLLINNADPGIVDFMDKTPIDYAIHYKHYNLFENFFDSMSLSMIRESYIEQINIRNFQVVEQITSYRVIKNKETFILKRIIEKDDSYVLHLLIGFMKLKCPRVFDTSGWIGKLINKCITLYSINCLPILLENEKNINFTEYIFSGQTFVHKAVKQNNIEAVKILLMYKADPCIYDTLHRLPIHYAVLYKNMDIIKLLMKYTFNVNKIDFHNNTLMEYVLNLGNNDIFSILIQECDLTTLYACLIKLERQKETLTDLQKEMLREIKYYIFKFWRPLVTVLNTSLNEIGPHIKSFIS